MRWNLKVYLKAFDVGLQDTFVYRWNFFLRSIFELLPLMGTVLIWGVVFDQRKEGVGGFDFTTVVAYFLIVLFLDGLVTPKDDEFRVAADIREGQLFSAMTLPVFLVLLFFTASYFTWPSEVGLWLAAIWTVAMAALLQFFITISIALLAFWMLEISTVVFIVYSFEYMLSGRMFPLAFMPPFVQDILQWLPFPYELYFPVRVLMNRVHGADLWFGLGVQAFWVIVAAAAAQMMWRQGLRKYQAVGG